MARTLEAASARWDSSPLTPHAEGRPALPLEVPQGPVSHSGPHLIAQLPYQCFLGSPQMKSLPAHLGSRLLLRGPFLRRPC